MKITACWQGHFLKPSDIDAERLREKLKPGDFIEIEIVGAKKTSEQRAAEHIWFRLMSKFLNDGGWDMNVILQNLRWDANGACFKEMIWKPVLKKVSGKESTEDEGVGDVNLVYESIVEAMATKGVTEIPEFPQKERM